MDWDGDCEGLLKPEDDDWEPDELDWELSDELDCELPEELVPDDEFDELDELEELDE